MEKFKSIYALKIREVVVKGKWGKISRVGRFIGDRVGRFIVSQQVARENQKGREEKPRHSLAGAA